MMADPNFEPDYPLMNKLLYTGKAKEVYAMTDEAINAGRDVHEVLQKGLIAGMAVVGEDFKWNRVYVPEVLVAARAMKAGMEIIKPLLVAGGGPKVGTAVMGTVKGDLHDIGKNLVCMMMEGAGFDIVDLGVDTSWEKFEAAAREHDAVLLGMSALLTTTMPYMKKVVDFVADCDLKDQLKVFIGGAPVTQNYADEIGADGYATNAASAVVKAKELSGVE